MEAIVLAGGLGTRLKSVVSNLPKPMAPIENKPFLEYILKYLEKNGITKIILSVGYKWETIKEYFGNNYNSIELIYSVESEPLGTGGAIKTAMKYINEKEFFIINGDTYFDVDLKLLNLHQNSKLLLSLKYMENFDRYGCVESNSSFQVLAFKEKEYRENGNINAGVYLASKEVFDNFDLPDKFSFEEFMENNLNELKIIVKIFDSYFIDIGIPEDYKKAQTVIGELI
ncbi:D-glycero-D-manno-heptose 1-phosphate guanosyltransferase [Arcobacter peruensis]|uniref:D-glycero-D-manno-heptose 1-phosphate guanosyltransferase n=1 Tax=Arcobacter peruensis TaxID=2320140 RepID=UPI000F07EDDD|nr:nucleotidyltransferase family protein [Arcobacter peruensis]